MESLLRDENGVAADSNEEICSRKQNQKRKSSESKESTNRKKIHVESEGAEPCCSAATVENVLEDMEEEIDHALEQPCYKNKLTPTNVKSILRHIIANEYVLTMVRNTMKPSEEGELGDITFEPKLTRSKAKEMRKQQCSLPWPVASPAKTVQKVSKKLLEEDFPDESSGDEDYRPDEECHSEDDAAASSKASDAGTPRSKRLSLPSSPVSKATDVMSEDENALVIALPELDIPLDSSEADKIALRTRSKLCLNDTPLEEIEASFIAPDITVDMYVTRCDDEDWQSFLSELVKPIDPTGTGDHPDDAENDPEYKAIEDEIPDYEDLRYEQITTDEWNDLMLGTYELAQEDLSFLDDEDEEEEPRVEVEFDENTSPDLIPLWMTSDERLQLDEQFRMYVQLLTQSHLLSHGNPALENLNQSTKIFLEEIKMFATREKESADRSTFYAHNLDGALDIVKKFEDINLPFDVINTKQTKKHLPLVPPHIKETLASSKVFIYPELLPTCGFRNNIEFSNNFNTPEDNLITLGLEQFEGLRDPVECIHKYLIPFKSVERIHARIKNCKIKKNPIANSIKFYHKFKQAPKFQRVIRIFDQDNIKSPEEYPPEYLPKWMKSSSKFSPSNTVTLGTVPTSSETPSSKAPSSLPPFGKTLLPKKYKPILPRGLYISPLHYANPFLKKYSKKSSGAPSICDSESPYKPPPLKPKPRPLNSNSDSTMCDAEIQNKVPSIDDPESPYKPPPLRSKPALSLQSKPRLSDSNKNKKTTKCDGKIQNKVVVPSIDDPDPPLKAKPRLSNSELNMSSSNSEKTTTKCSISVQDKLAIESSQDNLNQTVPAPVKTDDCAERRRKRQAARQAVWVSLSGRESSAGAKSSKGKTVTANKIDKGTCDNEEESGSFAGAKSSKEKTVTVDKGTCDNKRESGFSAGDKSSKEKTVTANKVTCENEKESESSVRDKSSKGKTGTANKGTCNYEKESQSFAGVKSPKGKTVAVNKVDKGTCVNKEESEASPVKIAPLRKKRKCAKKKLSQSHKDLDMSLALLQPTVTKEVPMKEEREVMFANSYLLRATEILKGDPEVYEKFLSTLCKYHLSARSPVELYSELKDILADYPALVRDFIVFLRPEQAQECGRYKEHAALGKVRDFFKKIEMHFKDDPEHISQILRTFAQLREQVDLTSAEVISALQPLLKNQPHFFKEIKDILSLPK